MTVLERTVCYFFVFILFAQNPLDSIQIYQETAEGKGRIRGILEESPP